jgi:hypothetical protein
MPAPNIYAEYSYNGCKPDVKKAITKWAAGGAGVRTTAREPGVGTDAVIKELKKETRIELVNRNYFESHNNIIMNIEMYEMWSFSRDKKASNLVLSGYRS